MQANSFENPSSANNPVWFSSSAAGPEFPTPAGMNIIQAETGDSQIFNSQRREGDVE